MPRPALLSHALILLVAARSLTGCRHGEDFPFRLLSAESTDAGEDVEEQPPFTEHQDHQEEFGEESAGGSFYVAVYHAPVAPWDLMMFSHVQLSCDDTQLLVAFNSIGEAVAEDMHPLVCDEEVIWVNVGSVDADGAFLPSLDPLNLVLADGTRCLDVIAGASEDADFEEYILLDPYVRWGFDAQRGYAWGPATPN